MSTQSKHERYWERLMDEDQEHCCHAYCDKCGKNMDFETGDTCEDCRKNQEAEENE